MIEPVDLTSATITKNARRTATLVSTRSGLSMGAAAVLDHRAVSSILLQEPGWFNNVDPPFSDIMRLWQRVRPGRCGVPGSRWGLAPKPAPTAVARRADENSSQERKPSGPSTAADDCRGPTTAGPCLRHRASIDVTGPSGLPARASAPRFTRRSKSSCDRTG